MKTNVLIYAKCGGEGSACHEFRISLEGMSLLEQILYDLEGKILVDSVSEEDFLQLIRLEEIEFVKKVGYEVITKASTIVYKAFMLTVAGKLAAKAWSRNDD